MEWQTGITAPKDGSEFLAYYHHPNLGDIFDILYYDTSFRHSFNKTLTKGKILFWMPIPNPPKQDITVEISIPEKLIIQMDNYETSLGDCYLNTNTIQCFILKAIKEKLHRYEAEKNKSSGC